MNDDTLAAVVAAARLLLDRAEPAAADAPAAARWDVAARIPTDGSAQARLVARAPSRWKISGRLRG